MHLSPRISQTLGTAQPHAATMKLVIDHPNNMPTVEYTKIRCSRVDDMVRRITRIELLEKMRVTMYVRLAAYAA